MAKSSGPTNGTTPQWFRKFWRELQHQNKVCEPMVGGLSIVFLILWKSPLEGSSSDLVLVQTDHLSDFGFTFYGGAKIGTLGQCF